jgi:large subunit ribosomal protein L9
MEIILLETINKIGKAGEIVSVKDGFANNFLLPYKKAIVANRKNRDQLETRMSQIKEHNQSKKQEAELVKSKIDGKKIKIALDTNEEGNLYGSINHKLLLEEIESKYSTKLHADNLELSQIKSVGTHPIIIRLYDNIIAKIELEIIKKS